MRSPAHRSNILTPDWERVGIGITLKDNHLLITEEFSTFELESSDINQQTIYLVNKINNQRTINSLSPLAQNDNIQNAANFLNSHSITTGEIDSATFTETLENYKIYGNTQALGRVHNIWQEIENSLLDSELTTEEKWQYIAIDSQIDSNGNINTLVLVNQP